MQKNLDALPPLSLFDRLVEQPVKGRVFRKQKVADTGQMLEAIKRNLSFILNSKKGCSLSSPDFGIEDFNDATMASGDMHIRIAKDIKENIERFEPRVRVDKVEYLTSESTPFQMGFRLVCSISVSDKLQKTEIEFLLDSLNHQFLVK